MVMSGTRVSAEDAVKWGLANHLYPTADFETKVQEFADALSQKAPMSIAASKKAIRACLSGRSLEDALDHEAREQQALIESEDFREGVAAFLSKRPPKFQGK
jgi:enoyl-CoA hydratase/carnithine racemase